MTNRERIRNTLQAHRFENVVHDFVSNLNEVDPTGEIELELRLEDIGLDKPKQLENFKGLYIDDQITVVKGLIQREKDRKEQYPTSTDNADLIRRLKALLSFLLPEKPAGELPPELPDSDSLPFHNIDDTQKGFDFESFKTWHTPDADGKRLIDLIEYPYPDDVLKEINWLFRCKPEDIEGETEKAIRINLGGEAKAWLPKSVILGWLSQGKANYPSGLLIKEWFALKDVQSGSPYCQVNKDGQLI